VTKRNLAREILGWEPITPEQAKDMPGAQLVEGIWYMPLFGHESLAWFLEEEYFPALSFIWEAHSCVRGGERVGIVSDARHAGRILKEWDKLDEEGNVKTEA